MFYKALQYYCRRRNYWIIHIRRIRIRMPMKVRGIVYCWDYFVSLGGSFVPFVSICWWVLGSHGVTWGLTTIDYIQLFVTDYSDPMITADYSSLIKTCLTVGYSLYSTTYHWQFSGPDPWGRGAATKTTRAEQDRGHQVPEQEEGAHYPPRVWERAAGDAELQPQAGQQEEH